VAFLSSSARPERTFWKSNRTFYI